MEFAAQDVALFEHLERAVGIQQAHAAHHGGRDVARAQRLDGDMHADEGRRAGAVEYQAGALQVEELRDIRRQVVLPDRHDRIVRLAEGLVIGPVLAARAHIHANGAAFELVQAVARMAKQIERFLQQQQRLRIHGARVRLRRQEERRIEMADAVEQPGVVAAFIAPAARRHGTDRRTALGQQRPELRQIGGAGKTARQPDHRDILHRRHGARRQ